VKNAQRRRKLHSAAENCTAPPKNAQRRRKLHSAAEKCTASPKIAQRRRKLHSAAENLQRPAADLFQASQDAIAPHINPRKYLHN
jgi:hypothetical protein